MLTESRSRAQKGQPLEVLDDGRLLRPPPALHILVQDGVGAGGGPGGLSPDTHPIMRRRRVVRPRRASDSGGTGRDEDLLDGSATSIDDLSSEDLEGAGALVARAPKGTTLNLARMHAELTREDLLEWVEDREPLPVKMLD